VIGTAYIADDVVALNGSSYIAVANSTGVDPSADDGSHWQLLAARGADGADGTGGGTGGTTEFSTFLMMGA
jgi:hypothetical protein